MGLMAMSASLNGASCAKCCDVEWRWVRFRNPAGGCSHAVKFSTLRAHREVQDYLCCRWDASSFSSVTEDLKSCRLKSSRCGRFSRRSKLDTTLRWRYSATNSHNRWRRGGSARCGSAESTGEGRKTSAAVLDVYLIRELLPPLVLGIVAFTVLGVSIGTWPEVMALVERLGLSFRYCLLYAQIVFLRLPTYIGLALPMASLLASMLAFGRLGVDSEVTALRAAGIGCLRMLRPTIILFMGITALHLLLAEGLTPRANQIAMEVADSAIASVSTIQDVGKKRRTSSAAFSQPVIYPEYRKHRLAHLLYAKGFNGFNSLLIVTFVQMEGVQDQVITTGTPQTKLDATLSVRRVVLAEEAIWDEVQGSWIFKNGCEYVLGRKGNSQKGQVLYRVCGDLALNASTLLGLMKASRNVKESRKLQVKIQQRISLPFASIVFGVVGCLLSLNLPHEQKRVGLALTLLIVFGYYSVSVFGSLIGQLGYVSPILGAWLPNLAGALLALALVFFTA